MLPPNILRPPNHGWNALLKKKIEKKLVRELLHSIGVDRQAMKRMNVVLGETVPGSPPCFWNSVSWDEWVW
jgi:hypothetical protein